MRTVWRWVSSTAQGRTFSGNSWSVSWLSCPWRSTISCDFTEAFCTRPYVLVPLCFWSKCVVAMLQCSQSTSRAAVYEGVLCLWPGSKLRLMNRFYSLLHMAKVEACLPVFGSHAHLPMPASQSDPCKRPIHKMLAVRVGYIAVGRPRMISDLTAGCCG